MNRISEDGDRIESLYSGVNEDKLIDEINSLNCISWNIRGLRGKFDRIKKFLSELKIELNVILIVETWLTEDTLYLSKLEYYQSYEFVRNVKKGGGVSIYIADDLQSKRISDMECGEDGTCESVFVEIIKNGYKFLFGNIYRPPGGNIEGFLLYLESISEMLTIYKGNVLIGGDFNIDILSTKGWGDSLLSAFNSMGLTNFISQHTRVTTQSASCVDNIFLDFQLCVKCCDILVTDISDHYPIMGSIGLKTPKFGNYSYVDSEAYRLIDWRKISQVMIFLLIFMGIQILMHAL